MNAIRTAKFTLLLGAAMAAGSAVPAHAQLGIFGCQAEGNKQETAAVIGGVVGAVLGNRIGGRGGRTEGTLIGGALGAAAGSAVGCKLQKDDQAKAERALEDALASNQNQEWRSDDSGAWGNVEVGGGAQPVELSKIKFASGVEPTGGYARVNRAYVSTANANLRAGPSTSARVVGQLYNGQQVWVPAQVQGQPWMLVSYDGKAQGYVSTALLKPAGTAAAAKGCKMVKQTVYLPGGASEAETYQACKDSSGQWALTRV